METLATLAMDIDVRSADPAEAKLNSLKQTAKELEDQAGRTAAAAKGLGAGYGEAGASLSRSAEAASKYSGALTEQATLMLRNARLQDSLAKEQDRASKQVEALTKHVDALRATMDPLAAVEVTLAQRTKLLDDALAKGAISAEQHALMLAKVNAAAKAGADQIARYGSSTKQTTQLMGQLAPQINDVVTGVLSGQKPFQILAQQGGQIYQALQMGPGGVGGSLKALSGLLNPVTVGVAALGVAFGGLAIAAYDAEKRTASFSNLAKGVGQDLGLSGDQLQALAATSAAASKASIRDAEDWTQAYVRMGVASTEVLGRAVTDTKALARALAVDGKDAAELLGAALADPISSLDALAKKTGGFDEALKENIQSLARHGELAQADALILSEVEKRSGGAADGVKTLSGAYDSLTTSIGNYLRQAAKVVFTNPGQMQVAQTYSGFGYNPILQAAQESKQAAANDNRNQALGGAARDAFNAILPKVQQIAALRDQQVALQKTIDAGAGALKAANLTADQARQAIKEADKRIADLQKDKAGDRAAARAIRVDNRGDNALEQAKAAELAAQLSTTKDAETIAELKRKQIDQEVETQRVRLLGQAKAGEITDGDAKAALAVYQRAATLKKSAVDQDLAAQITQGELASRRALNAYLDQMGKFAAASATTQEERNAIELAALRRRQDEEAAALSASNAIKVSTGEISAMAAAEAELRQRSVAFAEREATDRQQAIGLVQRDLDVRTAGYQNSIDILQSEQGLAKSAGARRQIDEKILTARYQMEKAALEAALLMTDDVDQQRKIKDALVALGIVYDNQLAAGRQLDVAYGDITSALSGAAQAIDSHDWASAVTHLFDAFETMQKTLQSSSANLSSKIGAVAGVAVGLGNAIGGTGGSALSGAGSGAIAGLGLSSSLATLGLAIPGPGWALAGVGAVLGGLGGLFGGSSAKKKAKQQAAAQAAAEEAQRQQTIADTSFQIDVDTLRAQGREVEAVAKEREKELAALTALSPALAGAKKAYYAVADAADAAAKAAEKAAQVDAKRQSIQDEIDKLTLSSSDLLAKTRAKERAEAVALDPAIGDLADKLYGLQDAATATADAVAKAEAAAAAASDAYREQARIAAYLDDQTASRAAAAQEAYNNQLTAFADAATTAAHALDGAVKSLTDFADSLKAELGLGTTGGGLEQAKRAFNTAVATGNYDAIPELGKAYADAAENGAGGQAEYLRIIAQIRQASLNSATSAKSEAYQSSLDRLVMGALFQGSSTGDFSGLAEIRRLKAAGLPMAANGGSFTVGGNGGVDNNLLSINGAPALAVDRGEMISVIPRGRASNDNSELAALRAEVAASRRENAELLKQIAASNEQIKRVLVRVTRDGDSLVTEPAA